MKGSSGSVKQAKDFTSAVSKALYPATNSVDSGIAHDSFMSSLRRVYTFHCQTREELTVTMIFLKQFIKNNPEVCVIILDSILKSWRDNAHFKDHTATSAKEIGMIKTSWIQGLKEITQECSVVVFVAVPRMMSERNEHTWQGLITHSYLLEFTSAHVPLTLASSRDYNKDALKEVTTFGNATHSLLYLGGRVDDKSNAKQRIDFFITSSGIQFMHRK